MVLQRSVYEERVQLLGGRLAALCTDSEDEDDEEDVEGDETVAGVDAPDFQFSQRAGQPGRAGGRRGETRSPSL